jgi:hypothetical protein
MKAALSQQEYYIKKLEEIEQKITDIERNQEDHPLSDSLKELYFKKGKLFAEIELLKRIPKYE